LFENGKVLFPKQGCEELIMQLTVFGKEKHDDLVDATTIVVTKLVEFASKAEPRVRWI
jgi:phage terminase large subunit-like protein